MYDSNKIIDECLPIEYVGGSLLSLCGQNRMTIRFSSCIDNPFSNQNSENVTTNNHYPIRMFESQKLLYYHI